MKLDISIRPPAEAELKDAMDWYELQLSGLGSKLYICVNSKLQQIAGNPEYYPKRHKNVRIAIVERFPYIIYFEIRYQKLVVHAFHHTSRSQRGLMKRLK